MVEQDAFNVEVVGSTPSAPTKLCTVRLSVQDTTLSRWEEGFDSPTVYHLFQCSSAVEQLTVNQLVVGSIPATGARTVAEWSRGSSSVSYAEGRWFDSILRNQ